MITITYGWLHLQFLETFRPALVGLPTQSFARSAQTANNITDNRCIYTRLVDNVHTHTISIQFQSPWTKKIITISKAVNCWETTVALHCCSSNTNTRDISRQNLVPLVFHKKVIVLGTSAVWTSDGGCVRRHNWTCIPS